MDVNINVMFVTPIEATIDQFSSSRCFPDEIRMSDSCLHKFGVGAVLVDIFPSDRQWGVFVILLLHTSVRFLSVPIGLLPDQATGVGFGRCTIFETHTKLLV